MSYTDIANSNVMLILCAIPVSVVIIMAIVMMKIAWKEGEKAGFSTKDMKEIIRSSAVFSIVPSLSVLLMLTALTFMLGKYFPWLRLSVVGSGIYETMAANMTMGFFGISDASAMTPSIFLGVMLAMTIGILAGPVFNTFFNKTYDRILKGNGEKERPFIPFLITAMFIGIVIEWIVPYVCDVANPLSMIASIVGLISMLGFLLIEKKYPKMSNWSMSLAMICGMVAAIIAAQIIG